jgi:hypothetical protein
MESVFLANILLTTSVIAPYACFDHTLITLLITLYFREQKPVKIPVRHFAAGINPCSLAQRLASTFRALVAAASS